MESRLKEKTRIEWNPLNPGSETPKISKSSDFGGLIVDLIHVNGPVEMGFQVKTPHGYVAVHDLLRSDGETFFESSKPSLLKDLRRKISFAPPCTSITGWSKLRMRGAVTAVHFAQSTDNMPDISGLPPGSYFEDDAIRTTILKLGQIGDRPQDNDDLYADTLGTLLRLQLIRRVYGTSKPEPMSGGLSSHQLKRLTDYIDEFLATDIRLDDLAGLLMISNSHLLASFKHSTQISPYQYVLQMRVERAKMLMDNHDLSLTRIATMVGFKTYLQFNRAFKRFVGASPRDYRYSLET
jgi:AraC family transcriptional regulator